EALAAGITAIVTQRLAPQICNECREPNEPSSELIEKIFPHGTPIGFKAYRGAGCDACANTGISGRVPVVELLPISDALRRALSTDTPVEELRQIALNAGIVTMAQYAVRLVREGTIPVEELTAYLPVKTSG
ncbi:MAG: protein-L-isoaspartate(D-aspartate) O-methyltransferase, partial [Bradymonadaceae bacterium]